MTLQRIFNKVAKHLLKQGRKSENPLSGDCMYRGNEDLKCAIGILIKDSQYDSTLEGLNINDLKIIKALKESGIIMDANIFRLLKDLQNLHDHWMPSIWASKLRAVAKEFDLNCMATI